MVVVDHDVTKGVIIIPCNKTINALGTAKLYHENVFRRFGLPTTIISDRGTQFASKTFQELVAKLGIKSKMSTTYHPQTDGQTERINQEIEAYLRIYCSSHPEEWANHITDMEFAHNIHIHSTTKRSPFELLMGYTPLSIPDQPIGAKIPETKERLAELLKLRTEALAAHELARIHMIRHVTRNFTPFNEGEKVWLEATNLRIPGRSPKLTPKREGPFKILSRISNLVYKLQIPKGWRIHPVFHASLLTPFIETKEHGPSFPRPPPDIIEGDEFYEVEAIIRHKGRGSGTKFWVKWQGYPTSENEWIAKEELEQFAPDILNRYLSKLRRG